MYSECEELFFSEGMRVDLDIFRTLLLYIVPEDKIKLLIMLKNYKKKKIVAI